MLVYINENVRIFFRNFNLFFIKKYFKCSYFLVLMEHFIYVSEEICNDIFCRILTLVCHENLTM